MHRVITALLILIGLLGPRVEPPDNRNGATWYGRAIESFPSVTDEEWDLVDRYRAHPAGAPTAQLRQVLARFDLAMGYAQRGARQKYSDYQHDYAQGFDLTLPHLGKMRTLARVMQADALVKLHDGHAAAAAGRIASMYRMGNHVGQDRIVISSLVGQLVWKTGDQALQTMLDRGALGPAEADEVLRAAESLPSTDPFSYVDATIMEYDLVAHSIQNRLDALRQAPLDLEPAVEHLAHRRRKAPGNLAELALDDLLLKRLELLGTALGIGLDEDLHDLVDVLGIEIEVLAGLLRRHYRVLG